MLEISFTNVMNGIDKGINMMLVCPSIPVADYVFHKAAKLWYIEGFSTISNISRMIFYDGVKIKITPLSNINQSNYKGFRGVFMLHPEIRISDLSVTQAALVQEWDAINERFMESWRH